MRRTDPLVRFRRARGARPRSSLAPRRPRRSRSWPTAASACVVEPLDARARAPGRRLARPARGQRSPGTTPPPRRASPRPACVVVLQFDDFSAELGAAPPRGATARFPLLLAALPIGDALGARAPGFGGFLDQNWSRRAARHPPAPAGTPATCSTASPPTGASPASAWARATDAGERALRRRSGWTSTPAACTRVAHAPSSPTAARPGCCTAQLDLLRDGAARQRRLDAGERAQPGRLRLACGGTLTPRSDGQLRQRRASYDLPADSPAGRAAGWRPNLLLAFSGATGPAGRRSTARSPTSGAPATAGRCRAALEWDGVQLAGARPVPLRLGGALRHAPLRLRADLRGRRLADRARPDRRARAGARGRRRPRRRRRSSAAGAAATPRALDESFWRVTFSVTRAGTVTTESVVAPLILVVDDNPLNVEPLCDLLGGDGLPRGPGARRPHRARARARPAPRPDPPGHHDAGDERLRGVRAAQAATRRTARIPVVFVTALSETEDKLRGHRGGRRRLPHQALQPADPAGPRALAAAPQGRARRAGGVVPEAAGDGAAEGRPDEDDRPRPEVAARRHAGHAGDGRGGRLRAARAPSSAQLLADAHQRGGDALQLIDDLLELTRLEESQRRPGACSDLDAGALLARSPRTWRVRVERRGARLDVADAPDAPRSGPTSTCCGASSPT